MNTSEFINKAILVHGNMYSYDKTVYTHAKNKVIITCKIHGDFEQIPANHTSGKQKCPKCFGKNKLSTEDFIQRAIGIHGKEYDYSLVAYVNNKEKVKIICPIHGVFEQKAIHHLNGKKCRLCAAYSRGTERSSNTNDFINKARCTHGERYSYDKTEYTRNYNKVIITCDKHGDFKQLPSVHLAGQGCRKCGESSPSLGVQKIVQYLQEHNIEHIQEYRFDDCRYIRPLPFDFYLPKNNICIEFDGRQHFKVVEVWGGEEGLKYRQNNDSIKTNYCTQNNIKLLRIKYDEDVLVILEKFLKSCNE